MIRKLIWLLTPTERKLAALRLQGLVIGEDCEILNGWDFGSEPYLVEIGDNVRVSSGVKFVTHDGGAWVLRHMDESLSDVDLFGRVRVGSNCHIGMGAIIMPGVTIGDNCIVAAGAVVTHDMPSGEIWGGVPAHRIETVSEYWEKNAGRFLHTKTLSSEEKRRCVEGLFLRDAACLKELR